MTRREIVRVFERLAFAAELRSDPRASAWKGAAWALRQLDEDLAVLLEERRLAKVRGIGPKSAALIADLLDGIEPGVVKEMESALPEGLFEVRTVKGLGAKKIKTLWIDLGITTLGELEYACRENRLVTLKGFGAKTQTKVLEQIEEARRNARKRRRDQATTLALQLLAGVRKIPGVLRAEVVGDLPRGLELIETFSLLVAAAPDALATLPETVAEKLKAPADVAIVCVSPNDFGRVSIEHTSDGVHRDALRQHATSIGVDWDTLAAERADAVYEALGLWPTPPERRDNAVLVQRGSPPIEYVTRASLRGALHNHTTASDGSHSLRAMRDAAAAAQLAYLGISEHSESAFYARGLDQDRLRAQILEIEALNQEGSACVLLTGVESDILDEGALDYPGTFLQELEVVIASVHKRVKHDVTQATDRLVAAALNPHTAVIGHPTGRLLLGRPAVEIDAARFLDACATSGCAVELNANPARLDLSVEHLGLARERGVPVSIAADAHAMRELDNLDHGVAVARRAGLKPEHVLNCKSLPDLRAWLDARPARQA